MGSEMCIRDRLTQDKRLLLRQDRCLLLRQAVFQLYICSVTAADICLVSTADICPVSAADIGPVSTADISSVLSQRTMLKSQKSQLSQCHIVEVSEVSIVAMSQCSSLRSLNSGNVTMFKSQIGGLALNRRKWAEMGPEWSPGPENRPPGMPRPFPSLWDCLLYTSPSPRDLSTSRMPSSA